MNLTNELIDKIKHLIIFSGGDLISVKDDNGNIILIHKERGLLIDCGRFIYMDKIVYDVVDTDEKILSMINNYRNITAFGDKVPSHYDLIGTQMSTEELMTSNNGHVIDYIFSKVKNLTEFSNIKIKHDDTFTVSICIIKNKFRLVLKTSSADFTMLMGDIDEGDLTINNINISIFKEYIFLKLIKYKKAVDSIYYFKNSKSTINVRDKLSSVQIGCKLKTLTQEVQAEDFYYSIVGRDVCLYMFTGECFVLCHVIGEIKDTPIFRTLHRYEDLNKIYIGDLDNMIVNEILKYHPNHIYENRAFDIPREEINISSLPRFISNIKKLKGDDYERAMIRLENKVPSNLKTFFNKMK